VILDAGGVIVFPNLDWLCARATDQGLAVTREDLFASYYRTIRDVDFAELPPGGSPAFTDLVKRTWFFTHMLGHAGLPAESARRVGRILAEEALATFPRESDIYHWAMPGVRGSLERLRQAGFLLGMASNNDGALEDQLRSVGVHDLFAARMDSGIEGVSKPSPELLLRAARALGVAPALCLFVGDVDRVDGEAARAAGTAFALLDPLGQPRLSSPLILPDLDAVHHHFVAPRDAPIP
jgi:HAD superfamily hydrolase (TIGR01509 family)